MNMKNIFAASLVSVGLLMAQSAAAQVHFFQNADEITGAVAGKVAMSFTIKADGTTDNVRVTRTSGNAAIDHAAVAWMEGQTLRPVTMNGEARDCRVVKEIKYTRAMSLALSQ